jgi:ATP-dependent RNA helicase DDX41
MSRNKRARGEDEDALAAFAAEAEGHGEYVPVRQRQRETMDRLSMMRGGAQQQQHEDNNNHHNHDDGRFIKQEQSHAPGAPPPPPPPTTFVKETRSLLSQAAELRRADDQLDDKTRKRKEQEAYEAALLKEANQVQTNALTSVSDIATGERSHTESVRTSWTCPRHLLAKSEEVHEANRKKWGIILEGDDAPPPIRNFRDMKVPACIIDKLALKNITKPSPIQIQGLPALFSGRDVIGIAFTGSGKTLTFVLPMVMLALEEEMNMPLEGGEGPLGVVLCPSRELARQTYENLEYLTSAFEEPAGRAFPQIRSQLIIGGEDKRAQCELFEKKGLHCLVATPGRLNDLLKQKRLNMDICKYFVLDEGDRMLDMGFDEEVHSIINRFKRQRQTVLFSATMPQKFQSFAKTTLVKPLLVNVGRAGAASMDIVQEVEYVKPEAKIMYLLDCLQKTAPPVVIFSERKSDVDEIHEYLLLKGVEAAGIHGGKDQAERNEAIKLYKEGLKDVLVATDIAAKGLDFPAIQHVINFDMPTEIENYVHRIGRTGRGGKTGVATTFINKEVPESALLDLKHLLIEAKQRVPPVLQALEDPDKDIEGLGGVRGCAFCGGLGHRITECPKLEKDAKRISGNKRDSLAKKTGATGDW